MSDTVLITLIIAVVILLALVLFRSQLSRFFFKAGNMEAGLETHKPSKAVDASRKASQTSAGVDISGNTQKGTANEIDVERNNTRVRDNKQTGKGNKINVKPDKPQA